ncbi:putative replication factor C subunit 4 [Astathelohania contejeani]|uniref:Replication factor C subunit 4 n=1 Tax=Astathelohania contejeani TaxID=164912 RepID=A0ABQ7I1T2_9MICR|nr:putative replication factor C subunit 4 [Thelohania contejeani]
MKNTLWTEKYRPKDPENFEAPEHIKEFLYKARRDGFPSLLLYGPPGTGKTTFAHLLCGDDVLELNASDERGIAVVRNKIKSYASGISTNKVVIMDECDSLTPDAQQCLRRIIEDTAGSTRFIFITNYLARVIGPLKSRLLKIRFECKQENWIHLKRIGTSEGLKASDKYYKELFQYCGFDLRRSVIALQTIGPLIGNEFSVRDLIGYIPEKIISEFLELKFDYIQEFVNNFVRMGFPLLQFLKQVNDHLNEQSKEMDVSLIRAIVNAEAKAVRGCSTEILLYDLCCKKVLN